MRACKNHDLHRGKKNVALPKRVEADSIFSCIFPSLKACCPNTFAHIVKLAKAPLCQVCLDMWAAPFSSNANARMWQWSPRSPGLVTVDRPSSSHSLGQLSALSERLRSEPAQLTKCQGRFSAASRSLSLTPPTPTWLRDELFSWPAWRSLQGQKGGGKRRGSATLTFSTSPALILAWMFFGAMHECNANEQH